MISALLLVLALLPNTPPPDRPPDAVAQTGWVTPNVWDLSTQGGCSENTLTYPMYVQAAPPGTTHVIARECLEYRYAGGVTLNYVSQQGVYWSGSGWTAFWFGHTPNAIGGADAAHPAVPNLGWYLDGTSSGGSGWSASLAPAAPGAQLATWAPASGPVSIAGEIGDGGFYPAGAMTRDFVGLDASEFATVNLHRRNQDWHRLWFTPVADEQSAWQWWAPAPAGPYTWLPTWGDVRIEMRIRVCLWYE